MMPTLTIEWVCMLVITINLIITNILTNNLTNAFQKNNRESEEEAQEFDSGLKNRVQELDKIEEIGEKKIKKNYQKL